MKSYKLHRDLVCSNDCISSNIFLQKSVNPFFVTIGDKAADASLKTVSVIENAAREHPVYEVEVEKVVVQVEEIVKMEIIDKIDWECPTDESDGL